MSTVIQTFILFVWIKTRVSQVHLLFFSRNKGIFESKTLKMSESPYISIPKSLKFRISPFKMKVFHKIILGYLDEKRYIIFILRVF